MGSQRKQKEYSRYNVLESYENLRIVKNDQISVDRFFLKKILMELKNPSNYREILIKQLEYRINDNEEVIKLKEINGKL